MHARMTLHLYLWQLIAALLFSLLIAGPAWADAYFWNGFPNDPWDNAASWTGGAAYPGSEDDFTIPNAATIDLNGDQAASTMYANASAIFAGGNLQIGTIRVSTDVHIVMSGNALVSYSGSLIGETSLIQADISDWQIHGTCNIQTAGNLDFLGNISGNGNLNITGGGTVAFDGTFTYTGSTTIDSYTLRLESVLSSTSYQINNGGRLILYRADALPDTASMSIASGAVFGINNYNETIDTLSGSGTVDTGSGNLTVGANNGSSTFSGDIIGNGTLYKEGTGTLTLNGNLGDTRLEVFDGTLVFNGQNTDRIFARTPGILKGTGSTTYYVTIENGAVFSPGQSIGTFTCGRLIMEAGGTLTIEVSGGASDQVKVTNTVDISATPTLNVTGTPKKGVTFTIINYTSGAAINGTFNGLAEGDTFTSGGYQYRISYIGGTGNNDVVLTALTGTGGRKPAPEPEPEPTPSPRPAPKVTPGGSPSPTGSTNGPVLTWPKVGGTHHYNVYRAACPTCPKEQVARVPGTSFTDETAQPGQVYYYFVRSDNGALSDYSDWMPAWRYEQNPGRSGDFNGDGIDDLLWWDPDTGQLKVWFMNGGGVQSVSPPFDGLDISQWLLVNTGDFNNDGICDLLWWNPETGEALVWYVDAMISASSGYTPASAAADDITGNVTLSYGGDLNADGRADLVWRDYSTGDVTVWLMGEDGKPFFNGPPTLAEEAGDITDEGRPGVTGSLEWTLRGLYDMNADHKADVVWQHGSDGRVVLWLMDGSQITGFKEYQRTEPDNWRIAGMGDMNGDGWGDIVWRNNASGQLQAWLMNGPDFTEEPPYEQRDIAMGDDALSWQVKAVGDFCSPGCDDVYCKQSETGAAKIVTLDGREFTPSVE